MALSQKELRSNIWRLAWPAILRMSFQTSVGIVTLILVGNYLMAEAVAAIGLAQRILFLVIGTMVALGVGTTALVAHNYGAGNKEIANIILSQSIILGVISAIILAFTLDKLGPYAIKLLMISNPDPEVIKMSSSYLKVIGYSLILGILMMIINAGLQGAGDMKTPMFFTIGMNILTIVLGIILIPGLGPIPSLGLIGAGLAEGISRALGGIIALSFLLKHRLVVKLSLKDLLTWRPEVIKNILNIGLPSAGEQLVRQSSQIVYTIFIAGLGTVAIAANQIVMTIQSVSFMPGFGFGLAATTLVGQSLGAKQADNAERYGYQISKYAMLFMGLMGAIFFFFAQPIAEIFVQEKDVADLAAKCLHIVAFSQIPFSILMVLNGGLRGAGDTRWVMYITTLGQWGIRLVLTLLLIWLGFGLVGVWIAMLIDLVLRSMLILWRYRSGRWKNIITKDNDKPKIQLS